MNQQNNPLNTFFTNTKCKFTCSLGVEFVLDGGKRSILFNLEEMHISDIAHLGAYFNAVCPRLIDRVYISNQDLADIVLDSNINRNGNILKWLHFVLGVNPQDIDSLPDSVYNGHIVNALENSHFCLFFRIYQDSISKAEFTYNLSNQQITKHQGLEKLGCEFDILDTLSQQKAIFFINTIPNTWPY